MLVVKSAGSASPGRVLTLGSSPQLGIFWLILVANGPRLIRFISIKVLTKELRLRLDTRAQSSRVTGWGEGNVGSASAYKREHWQK